MINDKRVGVGGIQDFVKEYVDEISEKYPYWNKSGGADHFYVACHSIGRSSMEKAIHVKLNAIQLVCSSSYFLSGYVPPFLKFGLEKDNPLQMLLHGGTCIIF